MNRITQIIVVAVTALWSHSLSAREFFIPEYQANPGGLVDVPISLDDASGMAVVNFQVNYHANVLELVSVSQGSLGQNFSEFIQNNQDGVIEVTLINGINLATGQGPLVIMRFRMLEGADTTVEGNVSLASYDYTDTSGVVAMSSVDLTTSVSGKVQASNAPHIDNYGNGLPDWWEELYGLDKFSLQTAYSDPDGDGMVNLLEYAFGGNPNLQDQHQRGVSISRFDNDGTEFLSIGFFRRKNDSSFTFRVEETENFGTWTDINWNQRIIGVPQDQGDGTEYVEVSGTLPMNGAQARPRGFMRVAVE